MSDGNKRQYVLIGGILIALSSIITFIYPEFLSVQLSGVYCAVGLLTPADLSNFYFDLILLLGLLIIVSYLKSESRAFQILALVLSIITLLMSILCYITIFSYPHPLSYYTNDCGYGYSEQPLAIGINVVLLLIGISLSIFGSYSLIWNRKETQEITRNSK